MKNNSAIKNSVTLNNALKHLNNINRADSILSGAYVGDTHIYKTDGLRVLRLPNPFGNNIETGVYDLNSLAKYDEKSSQYPDVERFIAKAKRHVFAEFKFDLTKTELKDLKSHKYDSSFIIQTTDNGDITISSENGVLIVEFKTSDKNIMFEKRTTLPRVLINLFEAMLDVPSQNFLIYYGRPLEPMLIVHDEFNYLITPTKH